MKVRDLMTPNPVVCAPVEHLGAAMWRMFEADCGLLPVTHDGRVVGVITDRDVAVSVTLRGRRPEDLLVGEVMQGCDTVVACAPDDTAAQALTLMQGHQLHRLPVVEDGRLVGIVTVNDLISVASAGANTAGRPTFRDVMQTLRAVCARRLHAMAA